MWVYTVCLTLGIAWPCRSGLAMQVPAKRMRTSIHPQSHTVPHCTLQNVSYGNEVSTPLPASEAAAQGRRLEGLLNHLRLHLQRKLVIAFRQCTEPAFPQNEAIAACISLPGAAGAQWRRTVWRLAA